MSFIIGKNKLVNSKHKLIYHNYNPGITWNNTGTITGETGIMSICYIKRGIILMGSGNTGKIFRSTDFGKTWTDLGQQYSLTSIYRIIHLENGICIAGSAPNGHILRSIDYGQTWVDLGQQYSKSRIFEVNYLRYDKKNSEINSKSDLV